METIEIKLLSKEPHVSQILTGYQMWTKMTKCTRGRGYSLLIEDCTQKEDIPFPSVFVLVNYRGKKLVYDMLDGYQHEDSIRYYLEHCDFYFKRSFSAEKNLQLGLLHTDKMYPLGFNYHVSCGQHPIDRPAWKEGVKQILGLEHNNFCSTAFNSRCFETKPEYKKEQFTVMFSTRLWEESPQLSKALNEERRYINQMRIDIIRQLRKRPDIRFVGGLSGSALAQKRAPELVLPGNLVERKTYLRQMKQSDICIGSMGLFESIGWKTGEYVAAGKAIVNERFHYEVPGDFKAGKHYLPYESTRECLDAVDALLADPQRIYQMKLDNHAYYNHYLRPDVLIRNTIDTVDGKTQI